MDEFNLGSADYHAKKEAYFHDINNKINGSSKVEARLLGLDVLPRLLVCLDYHTGSCSQCQLYKNELSLIINQLPQVIDGKDLSIRKNMEKQGKDIFGHLQKEHHMMPKGKTFSFYSLLFMLIGMAGGLLFWVLGVLATIGGALILGWLLGMIMGGIVGKIVEERLRKKHRLF